MSHPATWRPDPLDDQTDRIISEMCPTMTTITSESPEHEESPRVINRDYGGQGKSILAYLRKHGPATTQQISVTLGITSKRANGALITLERRRSVYRHSREMNKITWAARVK